MIKAAQHLDLADIHKDNQTKADAHFERAWALTEDDDTHNMSFGGAMDTAWDAVKDAYNIVIHPFTPSKGKVPDLETFQKIAEEINKKFYSPKISKPCKLTAKDKFVSIAHSMRFAIKDNEESTTENEENKYPQFPYVHGKFVSGMRDITSDETVNGKVMQIVHARIKSASIFDIGKLKKYNTGPFNMFRQIQHVWTPFPDEKVFDKNKSNGNEGGEELAQTKQRFPKCAYPLWQRKCVRKEADLVIQSKIVGFGMRIFVYYPLTEENGKRTYYLIMKWACQSKLTASLFPSFAPFLKWDISLLYENSQDNKKKTKVAEMERKRDKNDLWVWFKYWFLRKHKYSVDISQSLIDHNLANATFLCAVLSAFDNIYPK